MARGCRRRPTPSDPGTCTPALNPFDRPFPCPVPSTPATTSSSFATNFPAVSTWAGFCISLDVSAGLKTAEVTEGVNVVGQQLHRPLI